MRDIVVLGCGFAGFHAAKKLEEGLAGRRRVRLTIISASPHFLFTPLLPSVGTGELELAHLLTPLEDSFGPRTRLVIETVKSLDLTHRLIKTEKEVFPFDYLLIATGGIRNEHAFQGADSLRGPDSLDDAIAISHFLDKLLEREERPFRFALVGASSTGVQWAAELASRLQEENLSAGEEGFQIDLYEAGPRILPDHTEEFSTLATQYLEELGVRIHINHPVKSATPEELTLSSTDGEAGESSLSYDQVFHCAGRVGVPLGLHREGRLDKEGRIIVNRELRMPRVPGVYVAGDAASSLEGLPFSTNPQIALQEGERAALNLLADMTGRKKRPFRYEDRGVFLTLGKRNSLLELRGVVLEGRPAWLAYRLYYTALMPRAFQKARLLMDWIARRLER